MFDRSSKPQAAPAPQLTIAAIVLITCGTALAQAPDPAAACTAMKQLQVPGVTLEVTKGLPQNNIYYIECFMRS